MHKGEDKNGPSLLPKFSQNLSTKEQQNPKRVYPLKKLYRPLLPKIGQNLKVDTPPPVTAYCAITIQEETIFGSN
jgi:hypothetical protein